MIALTETAINECILDENNNLDGYIPIRKDLPSGTTHGGDVLSQRILTCYP